MWLETERGVKAQGEKFHRYMTRYHFAEVMFWVGVRLSGGRSIVTNSEVFVGDLLSRWSRDCPG